MNKYIILSDYEKAIKLKQVKEEKKRLSKPLAIQVLKARKFSIFWIRLDFYYIFYPAPQLLAYPVNVFHLYILIL